MILAMSNMCVTLERENWALRRLLQSQGLSDSAIQRKVVVYLKSEDYRQSALKLMHELSEETIKRLPEFDAEDILAELKIEGPPQ
jgi:hypothetical protein